MQPTTTSAVWSGPGERPRDDTLRWEFADELTLAFEVWASACIDATAFIAESWLLPGDTIVVVVTEPPRTAHLRGMDCDGTRWYGLTVEYVELPADSYVVRSYMDSMLEWNAVHGYPINRWGIGTPAFRRTTVKRRADGSDEWRPNKPLQQTAPQDPAPSGNESE